MRTYSLTFGIAADDDSEESNQDNDAQGNLAVSVEQYRQTKLPAPVMVCAVDATGTLVATGGADGLVKVWDIRGGFVTHNIAGHGGKVSALAFYISTGSDDGTAEDASEAVAQGKRKSAAAAKNKKNKRKEFRGRYALASGGDDTSIRIFDLETEAVVGPLMGHTSLVRGLDWSLDGRRLVSGGRDGVIVLWDTKTWKNVVTPAGEEVEAVGFLKPGAVEREDGGGNDKLVFVAGRQDRVRIWDFEEGKEVTSEVEKRPTGDDEEEEELGVNQIMLVFLLAPILGVLCFADLKDAEILIDTIRRSTSWFRFITITPSRSIRYGSRIQLLHRYQYHNTSLRTTTRSSH